MKSTARVCVIVVMLLPGITAVKDASLWKMARRQRAKNEGLRLEERERRRKGENENCGLKLKTKRNQNVFQGNKTTRERTCTCALLHAPRPHLA